MSGIAVMHKYVFLSDSHFRVLSGFIESRLGIKMPTTKKQLLEARLQKRLRHHNVTTFEDYSDILFDPVSGDHELISFIDVVTTNKTHFYRDSEHFEYLDRLLRSLPANQRSGTIKLWSVAASTGEEPYTMAMVCGDISREFPRFDFEIVGTDISMEVLKKAVKAVYPIDSISAIPLPQRKRYLMKGKGTHDDSVRFVPSLRRKMKFFRMNLMDDEYRLPTKYDFVFCRNVLIYFDKENQDKIMRRIYKRMNPGAYLFMGPTEGMLASALPLEKISLNIFRRPM